MAWEGSTRRVTLPSNWPSVRRRVLRRDKYCQYGSLPEDQYPYGSCARASSDADHKGDPTDHSEENLRGLCRGHHGTRSGIQGGSASGASRRARTASRKRPPEPHPGRTIPES